MCYNIDDLVFEFSWELLKGIFNSAKLRLEMDDLPLELKDLPEKVSNEWFAMLWEYDVTKWHPRDDDRALPGTHYSNNIRDVLEYMSYELRHEMIKYLKNKRSDKDNNKLNHQFLLSNKVDKNKLIHKLNHYHTINIIINPN